MAINQERLAIGNAAEAELRRKWLEAGWSVEHRPFMTSDDGRTGPALVMCPEGYKRPSACQPDLRAFQKGCGSVSMQLKSKKDAFNGYYGLDPASFRSLQTYAELSDDVVLFIIHDRSTGEWLAIDYDWLRQIYISAKMRDGKQIAYIPKEEFLPLDVWITDLSQPDDTDWYQEYCNLVEPDTDQEPTEIPPELIAIQERQKALIRRP